MSDSTPAPSLHAFLATLQEQLKDLAERRGINIKTHEGIGYAFSLWTADLLMRGDASLQADLDDVANRGAGDLGCDVVLIDDAGRNLIVVQTKFQGLGRKPHTLEEDGLIALSRRHDDLLSHEFLDQGNEHAKDLLGGYSELAREGYRVRFYFVTTGKATERHQLIIREQNERYDKANASVTVELIDRGALRELYTTTSSLERSIPDSIEIDLPSGQWFIKDGKNPCLIAVVKGNEIRN